MPSACLAPSVPAGPLSALAHSHRCSAGPGVALEQLAQAAAGADPSLGLSAAQLLSHFDADSLGHQARQRWLFPLLHTSLAGSDAQHLRALTDELAAEHLALQSLWSPLRLPLACLALGAHPSLDRRQVDNFLLLHRRHEAREALELLPLLAGLFTDTELAWRQTRQAALALQPPYPPHWH
jgi:hypothetical protein